ncbi:cardiolipin synthase [Engelhardtia mirabilis]|uniref:Cardiolipin synthase n=1 Tax=Engelhardtia mirabilis TaxID=2528011 RepID=A0A518BEE2_9BACT|nr:Cardiolipin synthase [Planctomycetes bacterium Pla133]QDU99648.1 Cardiolipin synthase [Planctomycetes bacterium Pla86]
MSPQLISATLFGLHWAFVAALIVRVIMLRRPAGTSMAWIAVIASAPFAGAVFYLLVGERRLGRARGRRIAADLPAIGAWLDQLAGRHTVLRAAVPAHLDPIRRQAQAILRFPAQAGNHMELIDDFQAVFDALVADIDAARHHCHLCFYIWHEGGRTADVVEALVRAAERGVQCRALADGVGSEAFLVSASARRLRAAGVDLRAALPTGPLRSFFVRRDLRNHRKIVVIDDAIAYTGSQNLVDPRFFRQDAGVGEWVDAIARVTGPAAAAMDGVFALDWSVETERPLEAPSLEDSNPPDEGTDSLTVQVIPTGPGLRPEALHQLLLSAIYAAQRELVMTTPYFVPDEAVLTALLTAAQRGLEVTLIVPARNDSVLVRYASVAQFGELMASGVRIALFEGGLLHTKSVTVDGAFSIFGSVNLDMRSLWLNFEISLFVYDEGFTRKLSALQQRYLAQSELLDPETWRERGAVRRFTENAARLVGPLL